MADIDEEALDSLVDGTLITRMGIVVDHVSAEKTTGSMPVEGNTQPYGLLHGGASAAFAETLGSFAAMAHAQAEEIAVGVDLSITHHRAMRDGTVRGTATALHRGRTIATYDVRIVDNSDRLVATARLTCAIRPRPET
ncbi:PaaI family thioesterase [uncultured Demequina sp.]|uniref:PaaI family thioesterase n=1 Tax=uncultured Demequina sp. TaxID=693499 RepID=UPI0025CD0B4D|nr:PaaI family thioesterase [uncultured Demequina sp.]